MRVRSLALLAVSFTLVAGCVQPGAPGVSEPAVSAATRPGVVIDTDLGPITLVLYDDLMPVTIENFYGYVDSAFYDGRIWERVVDNFVIQSEDRDGDPTETVPLETHPDLHFASGVIGMARDVDPDSATHVFFITEYPQPHLHEPEGATLVFGSYAAFGQVVSGFDVVRETAAVPKRAAPDNERPAEDVRIVGVTRANVSVPENFDDLYPRQVAGRVTSGTFRVSLEHQHVVRAGVPVEHVAWFVESRVDRTEDTAMSLEMRVRGPHGFDDAFPLAPDPADGNVHHATGYAFPEPGEYVVSVAVSPLPAEPPVEFTMTVAPSPRDAA